MSGDKVLLLLLIPCQPSDAKYFGPEDFERKVNGLNYIIETPDWLKSKQLCHINIIEPKPLHLTESHILPFICPVF